MPSFELVFNSNNRDIKKQISSTIVKRENEDKEYHLIETKDGTFAISLDDKLGDGTFGQVYIAYPYDNEKGISHYPRAIKFQLRITGLADEARINNAKFTHQDEKAFSGTLVDDTVEYIVMPYIDGKMLGTADENLKLDINPQLKKLNFRHRVKLLFDALSSFHQIKSITRRGYSASILYRDIKPDNLLISIRDPLVMYPSREQDLFTTTPTPENFKTTNQDEKSDTLLNDNIKYTGYSQDEFTHKIEKWLAANKAGSLMFAYAPDKKWYAYYITEVAGEPTSQNKPQKNLERKEIKEGSDFSLELQKINPVNAFCYNTEQLHILLKKKGNTLFPDYKYIEAPIDYETVAKVIDFGLSKVTEMTPEEQENDDSDKGTALYQGPEGKKGLKSDFVLGVYGNIILGATDIVKDRNKYLNSCSRTGQKFSRKQFKNIAFNQEGLLDYQIPGFGNIKSIYANFIAASYAIDYNLRPDPDRELEFTQCLLTLVEQNEANSLDEVDYFKKNTVAENLYEPLGKLILLSEMFSLTADSQPNPDKAALEQLETLIRYSDPVTTRKIYQQLSQIKKITSSSTVKKVKDDFFISPRKFLDSSLNDFSTSLESAKKEQHVTFYEASLYKIINKKNNNAPGALIQFQAQLLEMRRTIPAKEIFESTRTLQGVLQLQETMELRAKNVLYRLQGALFDKITNSQWKSGFFSRHETVYIEGGKYTIDKNAKILLDLIATAQESDFGYVTALARISLKLAQITQSRSSSNTEVFQELQQSLLVESATPSNEDLHKNRMDNLDSFAGQLAKFKTKYPCFKPALTEIDEALAAIRNNTPTDYKTLSTKIANCSKSLSGYSSYLPGLFKASPQQELKSLLSKQQTWLGATGLVHMSPPSTDQPVASLAAVV